MQKITADIAALCNVSEADAELFIKWVWALRSKNAFDMKVMTYPRTCMARVQNEEETIMLLPFQPVLMYESLAPKPGLTDRQRALGLWRIGQVVEQAMKDTGLMEAYFLTTDDREAEVCAAHGWEEVSKQFHVMKRRIEPKRATEEAHEVLTSA